MTNMPDQIEQQELVMKDENQLKVQLKKDAFNPITTTDAIYYLDLKSKQYNRLTPSLYEDILNGQVRF